MKYGKILSIISVVIILLSVMFFFNYERSNSKINISHSDRQEVLKFNDILRVIQKRGGYYINTAVLYNRQDDNYTANAAIEYLRQSIVIGLNVSAIDISKKIPDFEKFDILYLDESLIETANDKVLKEKIISFVNNGGSVFVSNNLSKFFPKEFFGAKEFVKLHSVPIDMHVQNINDDYKQISELIGDFRNLYKDFHNKDFLYEQDYGKAMIPDRAIVLAENKSGALYAVNNYGKGIVFYTNPILPNKFSKSSFSLSEAKFKQGPFSCTTATFNQLLYNYFAAYVAKQIYGFSINRVFGSYASPVMAWSLHYENLDGIKDDALQKFSEIVQKYNQIPSFSLVRNVLTWISRTESAAYLINNSKNNKELSYKHNYYENPFGAGKYIVCDNRWIQIHTRRNAPGGVVADNKNKLSFFPSFIDWDKDGLIDVFAGSSDGRIYYFKGKGFIGKDKRLTVEKPKKLDVFVDGYSSPQIFDIDSDGILDIITGAKDGNIYLFRGLGDLNFSKKELLIKTDIQGISLPAFGDINSDGIMDMVVGSDSGVLLFFYGSMDSGVLEFSHKRMKAISAQCADLGIGKYLSPFIVDYNKDNITDIILGTQDGYVAKLKGEGSSNYSFDGYIQTNERNVLGNYNLKLGLFSNPRLIDLNNDGKLDLIAGFEDVDLPYPIDSEYFPYKNQLMKQIKYALEHKYYIGMHYFSGGYASKERELNEINAHLKALKSYGINGKIGVNQHGGPVTRIDEKESYKLLYKSGLLWESFFESREHAFANWMSAETAVVNPFFIVDNDKRTILVQNIQSAIPCTGGVLPCSKDMAHISSKYDVPVLNYHHPDDLNYDLGLRLLNNLENHRREYEYNFVKENQMMKMIAAAYNAKLKISSKDNKIEIISDIESDNFPLYDKNYQSAVGVKIEFSERLKDNVSVNSNVWRRKGNSLYTSLDNKIELYPLNKIDVKPHLIRVNLPAKIKLDDEGVIISFLDDGLMQATVTSDAYTNSIGWSAVYNNGLTTFTKFGEKDNLHIIWGDGE